MIYIIGIGPGNKDYILPKATKTIKKMDIIISAKRNLENINIKKQEIYLIDAKLDKLKNYIKDNLNQKIGVIVSGDPSFYSMLSFIKRNFKDDIKETISGISSVQYLFNKLNITSEKTYQMSLHGRDENFIENIKNHRYLALLTDKKRNPKYIADKLIENNINYKMYIGQNLSYKDENIEVKRPKKIKNRKYKMSVVLIENEDY
ncbi:MAG: precorrin-6y C5,15-methyltransferase (decarboxylating) subunit CbiE [Bacillota bacterium]